MCYDNEQSLSNLNTGCRGHDRMIVGQLPMQSVPITTIIVSLNPTQGIQHYVLKCVSDLRPSSMNPQFKPGDHREKFVCTLDPRIHFALVCGAVVSLTWCLSYQRNVCVYIRS
jgi:hypothetical protein